MAYFVVGGIFMYTWRGARGLEVIPNYSFWKGLPFLVKVSRTQPSLLLLKLFFFLFQDGFFFTISPCYKKRDGYHGL